MVREALTREMINALEPREVAALFISRRAEGMNASEEQLLAEWLARDESHQRLLDSAERAWQAFAEPQGNEILAEMRAHALKQRPRGWATWRPAAAAAAVLLLAGGAALILLPQLGSESQRPTDSATPIQYASVRGEVKELTLPDGSHMTLDADSAAIGRFSASGRSIELRRGRAYFDVASDRSRPFAVEAAERSVVAVGTRFDVSLTTAGMTVTLVEGRVEIGSDDPARARVALEPGQQYIARGSAAHAQLEAARSRISMAAEDGGSGGDTGARPAASAPGPPPGGDQSVGGRVERGRRGRARSAREERLPPVRGPNRRRARRSE